MTYIFGIPVPLNEMLFILMVAQLGAIIAVLYEIRKLSKLLRVERQGLSRLEGDIGRIEQDEQRLEADETQLQPTPQHPSTPRTHPTPLESKPSEQQKSY